MASYSGNGSGSGFYGYMHARVEVTRTDYDTYSALTVTCKVVSDSGSSSFISGRATANASGGWGSYSYEQSVSAYGTTTLKTQTFNYSRGTSAKTLTCKAAILGGGTGMYNGSYDEASVSVPIPAISYDKPNAPSGCTAVYVSDSQATVSWTNGSTTTTKPRTATIIERQADGGAWAQVASVGSSATSYADNGIEQNRMYAYRVAAQNSVGLSSYATAPSEVYTTPAAPTAVVLDKTSASTVSVDVEGAAPYATGYDIESTYDGGSTWGSVATNASLPYSAGVGAGTVRFRVRAVRGALASDWTLSASLVTVTPPLAPTIVSAPAGAIANGSTATVAWTPNHPDGSAQEAAQVKVTYPGGSSTTFGVTTATSWTSSALTTNGTYTVQVRTKGLDPSYGEWSDAISWQVQTPPSVAITQPATDGATVASVPYTVTWTVTDPTGVSAQRIIVADLGGAELLNQVLAADARSFAITASNAALVNGQTYRISVRVMGGSGLVTVQTRTFNVAWTAPDEPSASIYEGDGASASISVTFASTGVAAVKADVIRVDADGSTWVVASDLADGASCIDPLPPLGVPVEYRIVASAASGATVTASFTETFGGRDWALNFGNAAQETIMLRYNPEASYSLTQGGTSYHFADGGAGGGRPVYYATTDRDESGALKFATIGKDDADRLRALCDRYPVAWLRDPFGHRWRAHVKPSWSHGVGQLWPVGIDWDAVRWTEAWDG